MTTVGRGSHIGLAEESTYGTPVSPTEFLKATSIGMALDLPRDYFDEDLQSRTVQGQLTGLQSTNGPVEAYANYESIVMLLKHAMGAVASTQNGATTAYTHAFTLSETLPTGLTLYALKGSQAYQYPGCKISSLTLTQDAGAPLRISVELMGDGVENEVATATATFSAHLPITFRQITGFTINGAAAKIESYELVINNPMDEEVYTLASTVPGTRQDLPVAGKREIMCNMSVFADGYTLYGLYRNSTEHAVVITYTGPVADGAENYGLTITLPNVIAEGEPPTVDDQGPIRHNFNVRAMKDEANGDELTVSVVNKRTSV